LEEEYLGKLHAGNRHTKEFSKTLEDFQAEKEGYLGKLKAANRYINSPRKGNIFPAKKSFVSDISAPSRESFLDYRLSYSVGMDIF
jgi:hypothetical protein